VVTGLLDAIESTVIGYCNVGFNNTSDWVAFWNVIRKPAGGVDLRIPRLLKKGESERTPQHGVLGPENSPSKLFKEATQMVRIRP
jgi:hypothetical protein